MYYCKDCGCEFEIPKELTESHGLKNPPFEKILLCPACNSTHFYEKNAQHCRCCGALLPEGKTDYCSEECKIKGKQMWEKERRRRHLNQINPISQIITQANDYNKSHGTNYTYGQYIAFIHPHCKEKY